MSQGFSTPQVTNVQAGDTAVFVNGVKKATTSGTEIDITGIPVGVKQLTVTWSGISTNSTSDTARIQLGDSTGVYATGYIGGFMAVSSSAAGTTADAVGARIVHSSVAGSLFSGSIIFTLHDAVTNTWCWSGSSVDGVDPYGLSVAGSLVMAATLDSIKLIMTGGTWDAGSINVQYDNPALAVGTGTGKILQIQYTQLGTLTTSSTVIPYDDTIPQNTEGAELMTLAITPLSSASTLMIESFVNASGSVAANLISIALFVDSDAGALAAGVIGYTASVMIGSSPLVHFVPSASTTARTYKIRVGQDASGTTYVNGSQTGAQRFGGVAATVLKVTEIAA